jgi:hypothetical protein
MEKTKSTRIHHAVCQHRRLVVVLGVFSWHTLGPLLNVELRLNATGHLNIVANQVHPFMAAVYPSANGFFSAR